MPPVTGVDVVARRRMRTGLDVESGPSAVSTADDAREAFQKSWLRGLLGGVVLGARQPLQAAPGRRYHVITSQGRNSLRQDGSLGDTLWQHGVVKRRPFP